jgi:hypothetical protein
MSNDWALFPHVMTRHDVDTMWEALHLQQAPIMYDEAAILMLASIIFCYYRRGLIEPERLAAIAVFLSSSRVFSRDRPCPDKCG